jgi:hypothetical protein
MAEPVAGAPARPSMPFPGTTTDERAAGLAAVLDLRTVTTTFTPPTGVPRVPNALDVHRLEKDSRTSDDPEQSEDCHVAR